MEHRITSIHTHLVSEPVAGGFGDATRQVVSVGYLIVRIQTDSGLEGIGLTYHEVGGEATRDVIVRDIGPRLIGRDPFATEVIWADATQYFRGVGRKGLAFCALSAVDIALWDLKGQATGLPLYRLLGGHRTQVPIYASGGWTSWSDEELVAEAQRMVADGYRHIKVKVGVEGGANPGRDLKRIAMVRAAIGPEIGLMLDANNCWDAATAAYFSNRVKELDVLFMEEPVPADDIPGLARFKRSTDLPLATGEHEYTKSGARDLILNQAVDYLQTDATRVGGYTEMLKISALAQAWNLRLAPHGMEHMHMHLGGALPGFAFLERLLIFENVTAKTFIDPPQPIDGYLTLPDAPGLGLRLNLDYIASQAQ